MLLGQRSHEPAPELRGMTTWASAATATGSSGAFLRTLTGVLDSLNRLGILGRVGRDGRCTDAGVPRALDRRAARVGVHDADERGFRVGAAIWSSLASAAAATSASGGTAGSASATISASA